MNEVQTQKRAKGYIGVILASLFFGCTYAFGSIVEETGMSKTCNKFWVCLFVLVLLILYTKITHIKLLKKLSKKEISLCALCGTIAMWLTDFLFLSAYSYLPVTDVTMLHFTYPAILSVIMSIFFREKFSIYKIVSIVFSIASMILITGGVTSNDFKGITLAVMTGITFGIYPILNQVSCLCKVNLLTAIFYMNIAAIIVSGTVSVATSSFMLPLNTEVLLCDILLALFGLLAYITDTYGIRVIGATKASFVALLEPFFSCVIAALFLKEAFGISKMIAGACIILSILFCILSDKRIKENIAKEKTNGGTDEQ